MAHMVYIDTVPAYEVRGGVVVCELRSGEERYLLTISRADFRMACETGKAILEEAEIKERTRLARLERRRKH